MKTLLNDTNIKEIESLISPIQLLTKIPITLNAYNTIILTREKIKKILDKEDDKLLVIVGPCSIHNVQEAKHYATLLNAIQQEVSQELVIVMRTYFEKPRSKIGWKGLINDPDLNNTYNINKGLSIARQLLLDINEIGLPTAIEFLDTISPQYLSDLISWGAIGARTVESQLHRELVSGLSMPIGFKNSTEGNIDVAIDAIEASAYPHKFLGVNIYGIPSIIKTSGNKYSHIILRGSNTSTNYDYNTINDTHNLMIKRVNKSNIIVDCSHGNSKKKYKNQFNVIMYISQLIQNGNDNITGVMIESNLKEGNQKLEENKPLEYGKSITDECINWEDTLFSLRVLANAVKEKRNSKQIFSL